MYTPNLLTLTVDLSKKRQASADELAMYREISGGRSEIVVDDDRVFRLDREDEHDHLDANERSEAKETNPLWDFEQKKPIKNEDCGPVVDHRPLQTPVKNQLDRGTCVCFASLACLESLLLRKSNQQILSEQYANWLFMLQEGKNQCDDGLRTTLAARYLSAFGVCLESEYPYEDRATVRTHCTDKPSTQFQKNAVYGFGGFAIIDRIGLMGPSIANPDYLEALLCANFDIVFGTHVAWGRPDDNGVLDVILDSFGNPLRSGGGHAMLIVGFNRNNNPAYFITKNSWGDDLGNDGYYYLSYDYVRLYAKYGYIVYNHREDMSALPSAET